MFQNFKVSKFQKTRVSDPAWPPLLQLVQSLVMAVKTVFVHLAIASLCLQQLL